MGSAQKKQDWELEIFRRFVSASRLPVDLASIEARQPPEPDVQCRLLGGEAVAFELVELIDDDLRRLVQTQMDFGPKLNAEIRKRFPARCPPGWEGVMIGVEFEGRASSVNRMRAVPRIVDVLLRAGPQARGKLTLDPDLRSTVRRIHMNRRGSDFPWFFVTGCTSFEDKTVSEVAAKFRKTYTTTAPVELLAYYATGPAMEPDMWDPVLGDLLRGELPASPFRRVWGFDAGSDRVLLEHPESQLQLTGEGQA
jgi:hypothetical protein